ncbi:MAG: DM13 domain-containing protein [Candidatus Moraniibacteriota bacterium]
MKKQIIKVRKINKTKKTIIKKEVIKKAIGDIMEKIKTIRVTNPFKKFRKPKVVMRKTYQKKTWKKIVFLVLIIVLILAIIAGVIFLVKKKKNAPRPLPKNSISSNLQEPGKVIEIENLDEAFPANGEIVSQGRFNNVEQILKGKALFVKSEGEFFLRLEGFEMVNGQDMHIYLSPVSNLNPDDAIDLGVMKSTTGNVNYKVEKLVDLDKYYNVLIWSNRFNAFFGYASLQKGELPPEVAPVVPEENEDDKVSQPQTEQIETNEIPMGQSVEKIAP